VLRHFSGCAGFPAFIAAGRISETGGLYLAEEFIHGRPSSEAMKKLSPMQKLETFMEALTPVAALHSQGLVHCAVSIDNFVMTESGAVVLTDYRFVRAVGQPSGGTGVPGYRPPEQWRTSPRVSVATDTFAIAAAAYKLLTGKYPFGKVEPKKGAIAGFTPHPPSAINRNISSDADDVVLQGLNRSPDNRFSSLEAFANALNYQLREATTDDGVPLAFPSMSFLAVEFCVNAMAGSAKIAYAFIRAVLLVCV
jgi:serine/threonine protein kinase